MEFGCPIVFRYGTARKTIFPFSKCSEKMVFPKDRTGISFLHYKERLYFFFPKIWSYSLYRKWKMIFLKKMHGNMIFSSNVLERWSFQKNRTGIWSFVDYLERWYFFYPKIWYLFFERKTKDDLSQEIHGNIFSVYMYECYKYDIILLPKNSKTIFSRENTLKGDWHSRLTLSKEFQWFSVLL